jgi:hypothetical protein
MSDAPSVFGLIDMLRAFGNGTIPQEVKLPNDHAEPIFVCRHSGQSSLLYQTLNIHKRLHAGEIGQWYAKHFSTIIESDESVNSFVNDKDSARLMREFSAIYLKGHPVVMLFENSRLLRFLTENGVSTTSTLDTPMSLEEAHSLVAQGSLDKLAAIKDMPEAVLDGRLGEIFQRRMSGRFCVAYGWPSLVTCASVLAPESHIRPSLYAALVGAPNTGKSVTVEYVAHILGVASPTLVSTMAGSIEQLAKEDVLMANGDARLLYPGELSHLLKKANVPGANFDTVLNELFYKTAVELTVAKAGKRSLNCRLSLIGGMTEEKFGTLFGEAGPSGFYDRFLFSQGPSDYKIKFRPYKDEAVEQQLSPVNITVAPDVWEARDEWQAKGMNSRVAEISLRVAAVCASMDGRNVLRASELGPAKALAAYHEQVRLVLKPNDGETVRGQLWVKISSYMKRHGASGNPIPLTKVYQGTDAYKTDVVAARAVVEELHKSGEYELTKTPSGRGEMLRWRMPGTA